MKTKHLYRDGIWEAVVNHPDFDLGRRELAALKRVLPVVANRVQVPVNVIHIGVGEGREVPLLADTLRINQYVLNDLCAPVLNRTKKKVRTAYPTVHFTTAHADIEESDALGRIRNKLEGQTLFVLVGNATILSNHLLDQNLEQAMRKEDFLLVTVETPHKDMYRSYAIEPVYKMLAQGGLEASVRNTRVRYDRSKQLLKVSVGRKTLIASYKPQPKQLQRRMRKAGMTEIVLREYKDLHMVAALFKKETT